MFTKYLASEETFFSTTTTWYLNALVPTVLTSGTGDVYTTSDGIPVASGTFTPLQTVSTAVNITSVVPTWTHTLANLTWSAEMPLCTVDSVYCSVLWKDYYGNVTSTMSPSTTSPAPTPPPSTSNQPLCNEANYHLVTSCTTWGNATNDKCVLEGANVRLFYFPPQTANTSGIYHNATASKVVQSYKGNITFTSPSIYLSFDYLSATSTRGAGGTSCLVCDLTSCSTSETITWATNVIMGSTLTGALLSTYFTAQCR